MSTNGKSIDGMPSDIYWWVHDELDGGDLKPFVESYGDQQYQNKVDFINGFTLAIAYLNQEQFTREELAWVRIAMSTALVNTLEIISDPGGPSC